MARQFEWVEVTEGPLLGPPKPYNCIDGWSSHTWKLGIEEGSVYLTCDCRLCCDGLQDAPEFVDLLYLEDIAVNVAVEIAGTPPDGLYPYLHITPAEGANAPT